jgi:elongation factor Ts
MTITAAQVKELRERTGAGMMECKKALVEANGDIDAAIEAMRKAGQAKAAKKAGRIAAEGVIAIKVAPDNKAAFMVEINTETDFAAKDETFKAFTEMVVTRGLESEVADVPALLSLPVKSEQPSPTIIEALESLIAKIGENIQIRRMALIKSEGIVGAYCHGGRIGVLVEISTEDLALGKDLAMHIAATKPEVITPEQLPAATIDKEKEIYLAQAAKSGKSDEIIEKMVAGQIKKFVKEISLIGQPFIKDPSQTIENLLKDYNAQVLSFARFAVGEGIEKQETDFAKEVILLRER